MTHPDIADEDFSNYFGAESKDNRLRPVVNLVDQLFEDWYSSRVMPKATIVQPAKKRIMQSLLNLAWGKEADPEFHDYFKRNSITDASIDSVRGSVNRISHKTLQPTDEAISALEPSELIARIRDSVPEIQRMVEEALEMRLLTNAKDAYLYGCSNAFAALSGAANVDMRFTEAIINDEIGRPLPEGVTRSHEQ